MRESRIISSNWHRVTLLYWCIRVKLPALPSGASLELRRSHPTSPCRLRRNRRSHIPPRASARGIQAKANDHESKRIFDGVDLLSPHPWIQETSTSPWWIPPKQSSICESRYGKKPRDSKVRLFDQAHWLTCTQDLSQDCQMVIDIFPVRDLSYFLFFSWMAGKNSKFIHLSCESKSVKLFF